MAKALNKLGVPSAKDIDALISRIDALNASVHKLTPAKVTPAKAKPAAKKAVAKTVAAAPVAKKAPARKTPAAKKTAPKAAPAPQVNPE